MAAFHTSSAFASGTAGVDYVERTFTVTVHNVTPSIVLPLEGDQVNTGGFTKIRLSFSDPGYDNPLNPTPPPNGSQTQESFTYLVNWGDGTTDTITVVNVSGTPQVINSQTSVLSSNRTSGSEGVLTTAGMEVQHMYSGPPDPLNPSADIPITVTFMDDNGGTVVQSIAVSNPGIQTINVAIDTTPQVPRLVFTPQVSVQGIIEQQSAAPQSLQPSTARIVPGEMVAASDRYLELVVVSPDGSEIERYRLSDEALVDLRGLFAKLPDNRYKIYLVRTDNDSRRLVMDVFVRRGRVIDPSDDSEGTRDRPPTTEETQKANVPPNGVQQNGIQHQQQQQILPLQKNPLLKPVPVEKPAKAAAQPPQPAKQPAQGTLQPTGKAVTNDEPVRSRANLRWALPLAGIGLVASRESWSRRVGAALEQADDRAWQRLRRAGRLGRTAPIRPKKSARGGKRGSVK